MRPEALVITGPSGAGKSTVGFACLALLGAEAVRAAMVDAELVYLSTAPAEDPYNEAIAEQGLAALYRVYQKAGVRRLLLPRVLLYPRHLELVARAVPDATLTTAWLDVSDSALAQRLEVRETGDSVRWHVERARAVKPTRGSANRTRYYERAAASPVSPPPSNACARRWKGPS